MLLIFYIHFYFNKNLTKNVSASMWGVTCALVLVWFEQHAESTQESYHSNQVLASPVCKLYSDESEKLERLLERHDRLLIRVLRKKVAGKQTFLSRFKFW